MISNQQVVRKPKNKNRKNDSDSQQFKPNTNHKKQQDKRTYRLYKQEKTYDLSF